MLSSVSGKAGTRKILSGAIMVSLIVLIRFIRAQVKFVSGRVPGSEVSFSGFEGGGFWMESERCASSVCFQISS